MKFHTSKNELINISIAWIGLSIAFSILFRFTNPLSIFLNSFLIVGISFLFHELMHKFVAQYYGVWAEFRANIPMLIIAIGFSFLGFIFAAPGGVIILGKLNKNQDGLVSLAGPFSNIILAILFLIINLFSSSILLLSFSKFGFFINSLLAVFNLIPFGHLDGEKVFHWNKIVWAIALIISSALLIYNYIFLL